MKRKTKIRLAIAVAALVLATVGGWIARREVGRYAGNKLLFEMIKIGDVDGVRWAVQMGADLDTRNEHGMTPLHYAALIGEADCVRILVQAGADVNAKDTYGRRPLHFAAMSGEEAECVRILVQAGADVDAKDTDQSMPLHVAARRDNMVMATALIEAGADVNAKTNACLVIRSDDAVVVVNDETPLDQTSNEDLLELLRRHGGKTSTELKLIQDLSSSQNKMSKETETVP